MNKKDRYSTNGLNENEFEPGSNGRVLKNILGIKSKRQMDQEEAEALPQTQEWAICHFTREHRFTEDDLLLLHKAFLGKLYSWAGNYRNVNLYKGGFPFAPAREIPRLMGEFSKDVLSQYTPCNFSNKEKIIEAISIVHVEFVLIHPFREGNGRLARLLSNLMAFQADLPMLNFEVLSGKSKTGYFRAIQTAMCKDYVPMKELVKRLMRI